MKIFSILKSAEVSDPHSQEDYFVISNKYPIFVVADGVSLNLKAGKIYPDPSGAGQAAKIFCETIIFEAEKKFKDFKQEDLKNIFEIGNNAVGKYNASHGRTKKSINYFDFDLFSATTAFLLIKDGQAYWWSLCDSGITAFNGDKKTFQSPNGWINFPANWQEGEDEKEKIIDRHKNYRNTVKGGKLIGYGAVTGEKNALAYLNTGVIKDCDLFLLFTDGFENYFKLDEFLDLFKAWPENIKEQLEKIISEKSKEDASKYGREKTLIAISI